MVSQLRINPSAKTKPMAALIAFNFLCKQKPDFQLNADSSLTEPVLILGQKKLEGNQPIASKLCELSGMNVFEDENLINTNSELVLFSLKELEDKRKLPQNCEQLESRLEEKSVSFVSKSVVEADLFLWGALYSNGRWWALKKDKKFSCLAAWFQRLSALAEFSKAIEFFSQNSLETKSPKNKGKPSVNKNFSSMEVGITASMKGKVVTRFPPEPSGYLHIGHVKAAMLNAMVAEMWGGKMIVRFDDTNPTKEKKEYAENILSDLATLKINYWKVSHTSDYFRILIVVCEELIKAGRAFVEDTPREEMKKERLERKESRNRDNSVQDNLRMWAQMKKGEDKFVVRLKMDMKSNNGTLRDPVIYRCNTELPHMRTGSEFKVYPTYDFSIVVVDTLEGVTNSFRSAEYNDRGEQFKRLWGTVFKKPKDLDASVFAKAAKVYVGRSLKENSSPFLSEGNLRKQAESPSMPRVKTFSRVNFVSTVLSKRFLQKLVDGNSVSGWEDPRFPTVQGILRRGLTVEALRQFTLELGFSVNDNLMEWDRLWSVNKRVLDPKAPRFTAIEKDLVRVSISGGPARVEALAANLHPKHSALGRKAIRVGPEVFIERVDAEFCKEGEEVTLIEWGNVIIERVDLGKGEIKARLNLAGDVKKTMKVTWLADSKEDLVHCKLIELGNLITVPKLESGMSVEEVFNRDSWKETEALGDPNLRNLNKGDIVQLQRKGFAIVDKAVSDPSKDILVMVMIPDSRKKPMVTKKSK